jgi:HK97 family phage major capsid protein
MTPEELLKQLSDAQAKAFADFKVENDKRLAQIEKNGAANATTATNVENLNKQLDEIAKNIAEAKKEAAERADTLEMKINRVGLAGGQRSDVDDQAVAAVFSRDISARMGKAVNFTVKQIGDYRHALNRYLRLGDAAGRDVFDTLQVGADPDGGYWVLPDLSGRIAQKVYETSPMRQYAFVQPISSDRLRGIIDNGEASSGWVGEQDAATRDTETNTPQLGQWEIVAHEQYAEPIATQQLLDDAAVDVEGWLGGKVSNKFARVETTAFFTGAPGAKKPTGFLDTTAYPKVTTDDSTRAWGSIQYVASGASGDLTNADKLFSVIYALKAFYRASAVWMAARAMISKIRQLKDSQNRYLWEPSLQAGEPAKLLGYDVVDAEDMPTPAANSYSLAFGNFNEAYTIVDRTGMRVLRDPFTKKGFVKFYTTKRVGGGVTNSEAIKLLKLA